MVRSLSISLAHLTGIAILVMALATSARADSSSPLLAAFYDRQMAIVGDAAYAWEGTDPPRQFALHAAQVGVGSDTHYVLTSVGKLLGFEDDPSRPKMLMENIQRFAAGDDGALAITTSGALWWIAGLAGTPEKIAENVIAAAVGDGANYYITTEGDLFVKGKAHRGQYGDGRLQSTDRFIRTMTDVAQITAHTGHAILRKKNGDVLGTGGNIYGPVGRHGLGDKADKWSLITKGARAIATGASHSLAIRQDGMLIAWGSEYGPEPVPVMAGVSAVAAGSRTTIAIKKDGSLWQWDRGQRPRQLALEKK